MSQGFSKSTPLGSSGGVAAPTGSIIAYASSVAPAGWLVCNGNAVSRTTYADLWGLIATRFGAGNGSTTFNLPDLRGQFIRGHDSGAGTDPDAASRTDSGNGTTGDNVGTKQADEFKSHTHTQRFTISSGTISGGGAIGNNLEGLTSATGGNETRPTNVSMTFLIKT